MLVLFYKRFELLDTRFPQRLDWVPIKSQRIQPFLPFFREFVL
jgi:hypothetical protein